MQKYIEIRVSKKILRKEHKERALVLELKNELQIDFKKKRNKIKRERKKESVNVEIF